MLTVDGKHVRIRITRDEFESRTEDLLNTTKELVEDAMESAGKSWSDIDHLLLVGGSTRMRWFLEDDEYIIWEGS